MGRTSWQQPCGGTHWVALAKQGLLDPPYNAIEFTRVGKLMEMLRTPPPLTPGRPQHHLSAATPLSSRQVCCPSLFTIGAGGGP